MRRADVAKVHSLRRGAAEAMEAIAHGDKNSSKVVGRRISDIKLPTGATIGAIVRDNEVLIAHDDVIVASDDHVILFLVDKGQVGAVERLSGRVDLLLSLSQPRSHALNSNTSHHRHFADPLQLCFPAAGGGGVTVRRENPQHIFLCLCYFAKRPGPMAAAAR